MIFELLIYDYTLRNVALGAALLGILSGVIGSYAVLKKQSLIGGALSHSTLPGIVLAFLILGTKDSAVLLLGAGFAALIANLSLSGIIKKTKLKNDAALGIVLSVFFGFGIVLLTFAQNIADSRQAGLDTFIFGQAATIIYKDVLIMAAATAVLISIIIIFWKEFKILVFDPEYTYTLGFHVKVLNFILSTLIVITIVLGLQIVGVILMSSLVVAPAVAARQYTDKLSLMVIISGFFGAFAGVSGAVASSMTDNLPTGPVIIIIITGIVFLSLLFAPKRGLIWNKLKKTKHENIIKEDFLLIEMYKIYHNHGFDNKPRSTEIFNAFKNITSNINENLKKLENDGFIDLYNNKWTLTPKGIEKGRKLVRRADAPASN